MMSRPFVTLEVWYLYPTYLAMIMPFSLVLIMAYWLSSTVQLCQIALKTFATYFLLAGLRYYI